MVAPRLSPRTLAAIPPAIARFAYDRARLRPRIVHIGLGAFFRAHGALYTEDAGAAEEGWGVVGASLRSPDQKARLAPQDFLYTATETGPAGRTTRVVGCLLDVIVAQENPAALIARLSDPATEIVTLTITEKGYCHDPASGRLDFAHPDIARDLALPDAPRTALGLIVGALANRKAGGLPPFTVATCDNLPRNGRLLRGLTSEFAFARSADLGAWIERNVAFPASMVDRIVPAEAPGDAALVESVLGMRDAAPVTHEPFRQWVLEDQFVGGRRPRWEAAGAQFVNDVAAFENAKLRMLNGAHSALAYLGGLAGFETIGDVVGDAAFANFASRLWREEIIPTLAEPAGMNLRDYADVLLSRFANPAIRHRAAQIAMDGSQKLPQRLLATVREATRMGLPTPRLCHAVAGWIRYLGGRDDTGNVIEVRDPLAVKLQRVLAAAGEEPRNRVRAVVAVEAVFGADLAETPIFVDAVTSAYARLSRIGARAALEDLSRG